MIKNSSNPAGKKEDVKRWWMKRRVIETLKNKLNPKEMQEGKGTNMTSSEDQRRRGEVGFERKKRFSSPIFIVV